MGPIPGESWLFYSHKNNHAGDEAQEILNTGWCKTQSRTECGVPQDSEQGKWNQTVRTLQMVKMHKRVGIHS